jgi:cell division protein FtsW
VEARTGLIPFAVIMGLVAGLIVLEPSFSVAIIILVTGVAVFYVGGGDTKQLVIVGFVGVVILTLIITQSRHGMERISEWWRLITDPGQTPGYHAIKAFFSRGFFTINLGGDPTEWLDKWAVPLLWSDYLFVNIGHDLGFLGAAGVVALFAALGYRGLGIALRAPDQFGSLMAVGITTWILTQATVHMGTALALIPATGQPLPFMSYGGSAMVSCMAGAGLLLSISRAITSPAGPGAGERRETNAGAAFGRGDGRTRLSDPSRGGRAAEGGRRRTEGGTRRR